MNNIITGIVQVSSEWLLQQLVETGTLDFIRKHNAMIRTNNVSKYVEIGNAMMTRILSRSISLTPSEHHDYTTRNPMIFKFLNPTKMGGITFIYAGVDWIQGDAVMADTGCDIMMITIAMALGMNLPVGPSNVRVHTSKSGQSSVIGEITDSFEVILCKGTSDKLIVKVGRGTKIKVMVAPNNSIYVVLLF
jgi:hypothetical protein